MRALKSCAHLAVGGVASRAQTGGRVGGGAHSPENPARSETIKTRFARQQTRKVCAMQRRHAKGPPWRCCVRRLPSPSSHQLSLTLAQLTALTVSAPTQFWMTKRLDSLRGLCSFQTRTVGAESSDKVMSSVDAPMTGMRPAAHAASQPGQRPAVPLAQPPTCHHPLCTTHIGRHEDALDRGGALGVDGGRVRA